MEKLARNRYVIKVDICKRKLDNSSIGFVAARNIVSISVEVSQLNLCLVYSLLNNNKAIIANKLTIVIIKCIKRKENEKIVIRRQTGNLALLEQSLIYIRVNDANHFE